MSLRGESFHAYPNSIDTLGLFHSLLKEKFNPQRTRAAVHPTDPTPKTPAAGPPGPHSIFLTSEDRSSS